MTRKRTAGRSKTCRLAPQERTSLRVNSRWQTWHCFGNSSSTAKLRSGVLPEARAKLGVLTLQQFQALSQFLNLSGLGEHQLSQGLHLRWDLRSQGSKLTQFQNER